MDSNTALFHDPVDSYLLTHIFQKATDRHMNIIAINMIDKLISQGFMLSNIKFPTGIDMINPNGKRNISINLIADG